VSLLNNSELSSIRTCQMKSYFFDINVMANPANITNIAKTVGPVIVSLTTATARNRLTTG
jgi:hypothetical protein